MSLARLTVDLDALARNYAVLREAAGGAEVAPAVKADGYGLGAAPAALRLWAEGARAFFVARLVEGESLRAALGERPAVIYVLDGVSEADCDRLIAAELTPVLNSVPQIAIWSAHAGAEQLPAALHVDTGMNRLGVTVAEAAWLAADPARLGGVDVALVMSHLACASQPDHPLNVLQQQRFAQVRALFPRARASLANSGGIFLGPGFLFDQVRPGVSLYGGGPEDRPDPRIAAVATLEAPILQVRTVSPGDSIGYGAAFVANQMLKVAILGAGYADGVLRSSHASGRVWFDGAPRRILGRVSMDLLAIDVTGCEAARPGAMAELIGPNLPVDEAARLAGTTAYELLTRLSGRAERVYLGAA